MAATKWVLDPTHSEVNFKVKHLMITNVTGSFGNLNGSIESDDDNFSNAAVTFSADTNTVSTNNNDRDNHLKSPDFFDAAQFPVLSFEATGYNAASEKVNGNLTIKGVTKPVTLDVEYNGVNKDPWGNEKAGFSLSGKINRKDWGLNWNAALETGGMLVSEDVRLNAEVQFVKQAQ
jgi:polyisoprenoid-binding protein YceI